MAFGIRAVALAPLLACVGATPSADSVLLVQQHVREHSERGDPEELGEGVFAPINFTDGLFAQSNFTDGAFKNRGVNILFMGLLSGMSFEKIMLEMVSPHFRQEPGTDLEVGDCDSNERFGLWRGSMRLSALVQLMGFEATLKQLPKECSTNMIQIPDRSKDPEEGPVTNQPMLNLHSMSSCVSKTFLVNKQCAMCQAKFMQMSETCTPNCAGLRSDCAWGGASTKPCMLSAAKCMNCGMSPWKEHFQCLGGMPKSSLDQFFSFLGYWVDLMGDESVLDHSMMGDVVRQAMDKAWANGKAGKHQAVHSKEPEGAHTQEHNTTEHKTLEHKTTEHKNTEHKSSEHKKSSAHSHSKGHKNGPQTSSEHKSVHTE